LGKLAIILHEGKLSAREARLSLILDFFAVPWKAVSASELAETQTISADHTILGSVSAVAATLKARKGIETANWQPAAVYVYADDDPASSSRALQFLTGIEDLSLCEGPASSHLLEVCSDLAGPMAGLKVKCKLSSEDSILAGGLVGNKRSFKAIISAGDCPVSIRFEHDGIPVFFCASSQIVDIEQPVAQNFYDVKDHFCSVVSLVIFIRFAFPDVAWQPQELGACLIVDDALLKPRYGACDFEKLRALMRKHGFTTNIAFIPWNWRRTSLAHSDFFVRESDLFSVSIHGCDHTAGEFGVTSPEVLHHTTRLAKYRMQNHKARTGVQHDSVMVFPQGVFSSASPDALKHNGFLAAVNTEIVPVDSKNARTRIRDVWDVAITTYGGFPIFTRRYAFHGLENFAFDLLLGKPCLIVVHQDYFKDSGASLVELIDKLNALNCNLHWRSLGEVIRRACRLRLDGASKEDVEMYGSELLFDNLSEHKIEVRIRKRKGEDDRLSEVLCDNNSIAWTMEHEHHIFGQQIEPRTQKLFRAVYKEKAFARTLPRSLRFELSVAVRRLLCEFRDECVTQSPFLGTSAVKLKRVLRRTT
jgi:hypothetical protein